MKRCHLFAVFVLAVGMASCQPQASPATFTPTGEPAFVVDFVPSNGNMCMLYSETYGDYYCKDGEFHLVNHQQAGIAGTYFDPPRLVHLKNFMMQAQMRSVGDGGSYGLMFRDNIDLNTTYIFHVRPAGDFQLTLWSGLAPSKELLPWTPSAAIHQGSAVNLLQVTAIGSHFVLFANGQQVASVDNDSIAEGWPGVVAMDDGHAAVKSVSIWKLP